MEGEETIAVTTPTLARHGIDLMFTYRSTQALNVPVKLPPLHHPSGVLAKIRPPR
jgi:hypothetical protein